MKPALHLPTLLLLGALALSCGGAATNAPVGAKARVPSSAAAQIAHAELYERWLTFQQESRATEPVSAARTTGTDEAPRPARPPLSSRDRLIPDMERFTILFAGDPIVPFTRACLALLYLDKGDLVHAGLSLGELKGEQQGTARDLSILAHAKLLRLRRKPAEALEMLRPLAGKIVEPVAKYIYLEETSLSAAQAQLDFEAIAYMNTWLDGAVGDERERVRVRVTELMNSLPETVLSATLAVIKKKGRAAGYSLEVRRLIAERLAHLALERNDPVMARELLDGGHVLGRELGIPLEDLAGSTKGQRIVRGRTVGLLLPVGTVGLREAAAETVRGVAWSMGLSATPNAHEVAIANDGSRLVTRDTGEGGARLEEALEELAGEGASVIIAGLDAKSATRALAWGDLVKLSVITLAVPTAETRVTHGVVLGVPLADQVAVLARYFRDRKVSSVSLIAGDEVGTSVEVAKQLAKNGGQTTLLPPLSCDLPAAPAGALRFPVNEPLRKKSIFWVAGSSECVRDVATDLTDVDRRATLVSTLEGGVPSADVRLADMKFVTVASGLVPVMTERAEEVVGTEIRSYMRSFGLNPSYWASLGRDAGALAIRALSPLPLDSATDERAIYQRRAVVEGGLMAAQMKYWTSSSTSIGADRRLTRTLKIVEWKGGI